MITRNRTIIDIGYKYNARKVISFIATEDTVITKADTTYLSKYPELFLMFSFSLLIGLLLSLSYLDLIISLTPATNLDSLI